MKIEIKLSNNRGCECNSSIIGKTNENKSTTLYFILTSEMIDKDFYIEFEKPDGNKIITPRLNIQTPKETENNVTHYVEFPVPNNLLDIKGDLKTEVVLRNADGLVFKTYTMKFTILDSINASELLLESNPDFVSETQKVIDLIELEGDGTHYLSNDGTYKNIAGGTSDYNNLENKPITHLNGTDEEPIYINELQTGLYIIDGLFLPYEGADISTVGNKTLLSVITDSEKVYVMLDDILNNILEHYIVSIDGSLYERSTHPYNNIRYKEQIITNTRATISTTLYDNISYQCSAELTRIILKFSEPLELGFRCSFVFKTGDTIPTFACNYDIKWHGDSVENNVFTIKANKSYTIEFWKDINNLNAEVREV